MPRTTVSFSISADAHSRIVAFAHSTGCSASSIVESWAMTLSSPNERLPIRAPRAPLTIDTKMTACWLGLQCKRAGLREMHDVIALVPAEFYVDFKAGLTLPTTTKLPHGMTEATRRRAIRFVAAVTDRADISRPT